MSSRDVNVALGYLRLARKRLVRAGARRALAKTRRAINSTEGALRHARNKEIRGASRC